jgi:cytochrome c-type biogenesis protein CcmH
MAAAAVMALVAPTTGVAAPRTSFNDIEKSVMCVSCNVPLDIAESPQADRTRAQIRVLQAQGLSKQQILDRLVDDYGPNVLAEPKAQGFNLVAYAVPTGAVVALVALGIVLLPRWRRSRDDDDPPEPGPQDTELSAADEQRLDAELARFGA